MISAVLGSFTFNNGLNSSSSTKNCLFPKKNLQNFDSYLIK